VASCDRSPDYRGSRGAWFCLEPFSWRTDDSTHTPAPLGWHQPAARPVAVLDRRTRDEVRLAQAEVTHKAKRLGIGAGLFGGAGVVALLGVGALVTAAILALAAVMPGWLAAIVVAIVLFLVAAVLAFVGKKDVDKATPPLPTEAIASVQADVATVKQGISR
jgi:hypothetical protein